VRSVPFWDQPHDDSPLNSARPSRPSGFSTKVPRVQARLDPRAPFVLDVRELGRRPGTMLTSTRTVVAPSGLGLDVIGVPEGTDLTLDVRLESVQEGVLVTATVDGRLVGECVRCLDRLERQFETDVQELFLYRERVEAEGTDDDEGFVLEGDFLDLEPAIRDAVVTGLPLTPLCSDDCPGLCVQCGARLADDPEHTHDTVDPRWAALQDLGASASQEHDEKES
jgi:uncharacterized protein